MAPGGTIFLKGREGRLIFLKKFFVLERFKETSYNVIGNVWKFYYLTGRSDEQWNFYLPWKTVVPNVRVWTWVLENEPTN